MSPQLKHKRCVGRPIFVLCFLSLSALSNITLCAEQVGSLYTLLPEGSRHRFVHSASFHLCILIIYAFYRYIRGNSPWCFFQRFLHSWDLLLNHFESESEVAQSCLTLCDPVDCSPPGSSVHGILQARILKWVAISSSRGSSQPRDRTHVS